jgi:hypothetical protein
MTSLEQLFTDFYNQNIWRDSETRSGKGSRKDSGPVRDSLAALSTVTAQYEVKSIADIPCGDFNWISDFLANASVRYLGYDIVGELVVDNRKRYPGFEFRQLNIVNDVPERVDLILCKDLLNHLTYDEVCAALSNIRRSRARFLLLSNNFGYKNRQLVARRWVTSRHLDITAPPLNYSPPIWRHNYLGLWNLPDLERFSDSAPKRTLRAMISRLLSAPNTTITRGPGG